MAKGMQGRKTTSKPVAKVKSLKISKTRAAYNCAEPKISRAGQNPISGHLCIATKLNGKPCPHQRVESHLPYCKPCMQNGDPSLKVCKHPKFGNTLVALRNIKKGYVVPWWGNRIAKEKLPAKAWEWALESRFGVIDATPFKHRSQMQFCQCVGPSEKPVIDDCPDHYERLLARKEKTCLLFSTMCDVPKRHQLTMMYNKDEKTTNDFFKDRGLVRSDVGCRKYPALKKKEYARKRARN